MLAGTGAVWLGERVVERWPRTRGLLVHAGAAAAVAVICFSVLQAPVELTFRLEYTFFREHLGDVHAGCRIVRTRCSGDRGMEPPARLSRLRGLG